MTRKEVDVVRFNRGDYYFYDLYYNTQYSVLVDKLVDALSPKGSFSENSSDIYRVIYSNHLKIDEIILFFFFFNVRTQSIY